MTIPAAPSRKRPSRYTLVVAALAIVCAVGLRIKQTYDERRSVLADVTIAGHLFHAEVADTSAKQELGLGKRDALASDAALYFPMSSPSRWVFWMKDMRFPIDIVWISDNKVVDVSANAPVPPPTGEPATFTPSDPADAILEINAGQAAQFGIYPGAEVTIRSLR